MNTRTFDVSGAVVFWRLGRTRREALSPLGLCGMGDLVPEQRTPKAILQHALTDIYGDPKTLVRPLAKEDSFEVVRETRGQDGNSYTGLLTATAGKDGVESVSPWSEEDKVRVKFRELAGELPGPVVAGALVKIVTRMGGIALRPHGGIYWLPDAKLDLWRQVATIVEGAAIEGDPSCMYVMQTSKDEATLRAVKDGIVTEISDKLADLKPEILSGTLGERALQTRAAQIVSMTTLIGQYETILGEALTELRTQLGDADTLASQAILLASAEAQKAVTA